MPTAIAFPPSKPKKSSPAVVTDTAALNRARQPITESWVGRVPNSSRAATQTGCLSMRPNTSAAVDPATE
jgi:hypothetical protein